MRTLPLANLDRVTLIKFDKSANLLFGFVKKNVNPFLKKLQKIDNRNGIRFLP